MKEYKVKDLLTIKNGRDHKHLGDGLFPVYGSGGIMRYADDYLYDKPSILLPRKGTLDNIQYCDTPFWCVDTTYYSEVNDELANPYYLYRYLNLLDLKNLDSGTALPSMTFDSYYQIKVNLPDIETQNKIAKALYSLDQKISLNTRMNAELEAMAKQLYDYWFVQFDFPDETGKPYKSSGGKMMWNEKLKREIPEGWEVMNIFDVSDVLYGFPFRTDCFVTEITEKPVVRIRDIIDNTSSAYTTEDVDDIYRLKEGDLVVGMDGNFHMNYWHNNSSYLNQRCVRFRDIPEVALSTVHLFYSIKPILEHKQKSIKGSTVGHLLDSDIKDFWILCPSKKYRKEMKQNMDSILRIITKNKNEMIHLTHLRDSLLPMLMNGQVTIE